jgi:hypothetical protein
VKNSKQRQRFSEISAAFEESLNWAIKRSSYLVRATVIKKRALVTARAPDFQNLERRA